ncbi:hypothetical protein ABZ904_48135, partial [Streptomyces sp. NPDC046900]|uniref:hypothetical protein n=1 Tax=Streptomyces sp. NPDC046900 TaxID=3155473 RepID=UPI0033F3F24C
HDGVAKCHRGVDHLGAHCGSSEAGSEYTWPNQGGTPRAPRRAAATARHKLRRACTLRRSSPN